MTKKVNMKSQMLISIIPFGWLYTFWCVDKLNKGFVFLIGTALVSIICRIFFMFPVNVLVGVIVVYPFMLHYVHKWSKEWNQSFDKHNSQSTLV